MKLVNEKDVIKSLNNFKHKPFDYCVIDNFFPTKISNELCDRFPKYSSKIWHTYKNSIENKKTCNNWNLFDDLTYRVFCYLNSDTFVNLVSKKIGIKLFIDPGLHGGGWHIHSNKGNLNPHLDYSIHPKMDIQRRLNLIVYLEKHYKVSYGGHLGLWEHDKENNLPGDLKKEIFPKFNRAVIFDTSQKRSVWNYETSSFYSPLISRGMMAVVETDSTIRAFALKTLQESWVSDEYLNRELSNAVNFKGSLVVGDFEGHIHIIDLLNGRTLSRKKVSKKPIKTIFSRSDSLYVVDEAFNLISINI